MIEFKDTNVKWVKDQFNTLIKAGFYIKRIMQVEKTSFLVLVEANDLEKCHKIHEKLLMNKPLEEEDGKSV